MLFILIAMIFCLPGGVSAVNLDIIYQGEQTVDMRIWNDISQDWKKFEIKRGSSSLETWETQSDGDIYYSDSCNITPFSSHIYTLLSYWGTDGTNWFGYGTDIENVDTSIMSGTLHNDSDWLFRLDRMAVFWGDAADYTVSFVNVVDGYLDIYDTTVWLNSSTNRLKATGPGTISASGATFTSNISDGGLVEFSDQTDLYLDQIEGCTFQSVDLALKSCIDAEIKDSGLNDCQVTTDSHSSGTVFNNCTGSYDLIIAGTGETVRDCTGILELYITGANHSILRNELYNMEARGDSCTIRDNTFDSAAHTRTRFDLYGNSNHVLENTLEHREADSGYSMIRILGDGNTVEKNVITEYVAGAGAWHSGIDIQGGTNNTVQLNRIIGLIVNSGTGNHGILLDDATGNLVKKNTIKNCQNGIWLGFPKPASDNNIENNAISSTIRAAIDVGDNCNTNVFAYNHIWDGSTGMYISGDGNGIHENIISDCYSRGIHLMTGSSNCLVYNNVFRNNNSRPVDNGSGNRWNKTKIAVNSNIVGGPFLGGNYWDTYTGHDSDGDKLGDTPYPISGSAAVSDGLPLIYVSMPSPTPGPTPSGLGTIVSGDYSGDGAADLAIFRESTGLWAIRGVTRIYFGTESDLPVSGDYNGDGSSDIALFRGSSGLWVARGVTRVYFGGSSDSPAAGDYNGDGSCDIGIFRESSGLWAIRGVTRTYFGTGSDLPVSGDYNGDGSADIALFRGGSGLWAIRSVTRAYFGDSGDLPLPGDYSGSGARSPAIFRESSGLWAARGVTRLYFGASGDRPVPADFSGSGGDDFGIFRPSSGLWAIKGITRVYYGSSIDVPVTR
ncbi:MAG: NosD domain-containing protein [Candidatus Auribacterota bacterium]|nr:NosD domain-containing protein [Candidatus Auribacterota bacterium]